MSGFEAQSSAPTPDASGADASQAAHPNARTLALIGIAFFGVVSVALFAACVAWPASNFWGPGVSTILAWALFGVHLLLSGRRLGSFDPLLWIPILVLLHYFGMSLSINVISPDAGSYDGWGLGTPPKLGLGFATALLAHSALLLGFYLRGIFDLSGPPSGPAPGERSILGPAMIMMIGGVFMVLLGIVIAGPKVVFGSYGILKDAEKFGLADLRFFSSGFLFAMGGIYGVLASHASSRDGLRLVLALGAAAGIGLLLILIGDRTGLSVLCIAGGWAFTQRVLRIPRWVAIAAFLFALVAMPVIKEFRVHRNVQDAQSRSLRQQIASTTYEMGTTLLAFCYSVDRIPSEKPYDWGLSIVAQTMNQVPNLGTTTGFALGFGGLAHNPSKWLTATANPVKFQNNAGGYAYALGAEWYFNFGMFGVLAGMALTGYLVTAVRNNARRSPMWLTFSALLLGTMLVIVRNDLGYPLRTMLWPMIGYGMLTGIWRLVLGPRFTVGNRDAPYDPRDHPVTAR